MALQGMRLVNCIRAREHLSYTKKSLETWTLVESLTYSTTSSCTFSGNGILSLREHTEVEAFCLVKVAPLPRERLQVRESRGKRLLVHCTAMAKELGVEKVTQLQVRTTEVIFEAILQK